MNIKRGLFRLWLVCGLLFASATILFTYDQISREFTNASALAKVPDTTTFTIPIGCWNKRGAAKIDYITENGGGESAPWELCWYPVAKVRAMFPEYAQFDDADLKDETYIDAKIPRYPAHPWQSLFGVLGFAFGVPLFFLVVGVAFVWAFSGFARPASKV